MRRETSKTNKTVVVVVEIGSPFFSEAKRGTSQPYTGKIEARQTLHQRRATMEKYICNVCSYEYDPEVGDPDGGIEPGTPFENIPDDWVCPVCGAQKDQFQPKE